MVARVPMKTTRDTATPIPKLAGSIGGKAGRAAEHHLSLREMREALGLTQSEVADRLNKSQGELSKLERRKDVHLSTLRSYVAAMGGEMEVVIRFETRVVRLKVV